MYVHSLATVEMLWFKIWCHNGEIVYLQYMYLENKISLQNKACINKIVVLCEKILIKHVF